MRILFLFIIVLHFFSCSVIRDSPKFGLANGVYHSSAFGNANKKVYVENEEETIYVYPATISAALIEIDTASQNKISFFSQTNEPLPKTIFLRRPSFDLDFLTIPVKYRLPQKEFPRQLTASINGAVYAGYRTDVYSISYKQTPLTKALRNVTHYGFSFGGFTGLGATAMNPWVTANRIDIEYDGIVWSKGVTGIIAVNNFTAGLALGWDHLLDDNRRFWIYQNKPWIGFVFGLNLN